jgi:molybdate transport system permease protein
MNAPMAMDWFPLWLSLRVASLATLIALPVALALARLLAGRQFRGKAALEAVVRLPLYFPTTVVAYYFLVLLGQGSLLGGVYESLFGGPLLFTWQAAVLAAFIHAAPLLTQASQRALEGVDRDYGRAARSLGASEWRTFWRVTLPVAQQPVAAATILAFARALGDFGITIMIAGNFPGRTQTMPVAIYSAVQSGNGAVARALVLVVSAVILGLFLLAGRFEPKRATR